MLQIRRIESAMDWSIEADDRIRVSGVRHGKGGTGVHPFKEMNTDTDCKLYTIGQVSNLLDIPIRTIRYYESVDLARPYRIDPETNYRYYSMEEIFRLDLVRCLGRELGMPLKKIREYIERQHEPATLKQYLIEQADDINGQIDVLLKRKSFLLSKLKAVTFRELLRTRLKIPRVVIQEERRVFVKHATLEDTEETILSVRRVLQEAESQYDRTAFLLRKYEDEDMFTNGFGDVLIGMDEPLASPYFEVILPAGRYAEIIYENRIDKRNEAVSLFMDFIAQSGFSPEGYMVFSGTMLDAISIRSDSYYFKVQMKLMDNVENATVLDDQEDPLRGGSSSVKL
jgi:MerR family transcriptional activator of bmr gene